MFKYMRDGLSDDWGILELQDKILEIAVFMDRICKDYGIKYYLMGGSALGAKRHSGFIPWDDDLDFFMTPDNYEKFRSVFNMNCQDGKFYLQEWGAVDGMVTIAKVRLNGTTYIEELLKKFDMHHGVFVDIFLLHNCPNNPFSRIHQYVWSKYLVVKGCAEKNYKRKKGILGLIIKTLRLLPTRFLLKHALKQVYKYRNTETKNYCNFLGRAKYKNGIYSKSYFLDGEYVEFEKVKLMVPSKLHDFLHDRFGDYMQPPSLKTIKLQQHAETWNVCIDFREILPNCSEFKDEYRLIA